jgi:hypothetical protein
MFDGMPADWLSWSLGAGLSFIFLWLISVPPVRVCVNEARADDASSRSHARNERTCRNITRRAERID